MRILMYTWEFPPYISGGLGMACYGMVKSLLKQGVKIYLVLPTKEPVYFNLEEEGDVDTMPAVYLEAKKQVAYEELSFPSLKERLEYIGFSHRPESYLQTEEIQKYLMKFHTIDWIQKSIATEKEQLLDEMISNLSGHEDLLQKVQEYTIRAEKLAETLSFDLIHAHDWLCYPAGMLTKNIKDKPLVVHIHATEFDRSGGPGDERIHKLEHAGMMFADRVIAVSQYTAQMIMSRYRIDSGKIKIVHNAFTIQPPEENKVKRIFRGPTILFLGRITLQKGPDYFLEVADIVLKKHPEARFIMAGSGDMARKLLRQSASLKMRNRFLFSGFLNRRQVERILRASDIYVLPSVSEPFGIAPLEAMAYGVTAIISRQSGVSEVVKNAFKIDFWDTKLMADTIIYLIENPDVCKKMGEDGMREVQNIQWDEAAVKIRQVYSGVSAEYLNRM